MQKIKANFGCGNNIKEGYLNFDKYPINDSVHYLDLNRLPLPFSENYFDEILLLNVIEHLDINHIELLKNIHFVLKPFGVLTIQVPINMDIVTHTKPFFNINYFYPVIISKDAPVNRSNKAHMTKMFKLLSTYRILNKSLWSKLITFFPKIEGYMPHLTHGQIVFNLLNIKD